jgi:hypothetical protein
MKVHVGVKLDAVLKPCDLRSGRAPGNAEESNLVSQHVFKVKMGRHQDLGTLKQSLSLSVISTLLKLERLQLDEISRIIGNFPQKL